MSAEDILDLYTEAMLAAGKMAQESAVDISDLLIAPVRPREPSCGLTVIEGGKAPQSSKPN